MRAVSTEEEQALGTERPGVEKIQTAADRTEVSPGETCQCCGERRLIKIILKTRNSTKHANFPKYLDLRLALLLARQLRRENLFFSVSIVSIAFKI